MKKKKLKIVFLTTEDNDREELLVYLVDSCSSCIINCKAVCEGRPNSRKNTWHS